MRNNTRRTAIVAICIGSFLGVSASGQDASKEDVRKKLRALAGTARAVGDVQEIENLMSRHVFQNRWSLKPGDADFRETVAQKAEGVSYGRDEQYVYDGAARKALHGLDDSAFGKADALNMRVRKIISVTKNAPHVMLPV
jgi:hypothetical protein